MHDQPTPHIDGTHHRRESKSKGEMRPLLTREPLPQDRERRPPPQPPRKRRRAPPTTPAFTFDPMLSNVPTGRQDPPPSTPIASGHPVSEPLTGSHDEQPPTPYSDHDIHNQVYEGYEAQRRPRIFSECPPAEHSTPFCPDTSCADSNDTSSLSPPASSDQTSRAAEYGYARPVQPPVVMYPYVSQGYGPPPVVHQESYGYPMDPCAERPAQAYPAQHFDATHGRPTYPENNGYQYPHRRF